MSNGLYQGFELTTYDLTLSVLSDLVMFQDTANVDFTKIDTAEILIM